MPAADQRPFVSFQRCERDDGKGEASLTTAAICCFHPPTSESRNQGQEQDVVEYEAKF